MIQSTARLEKLQHLQSLLQRGMQALAAGDIQRASDCCQQVLRIQPDLVQGHFLVGLVALESRNRKIAFSAFSSVVKLQKEHPAAWAQLAKLHMGEGQVNAADAALGEALKYRSEDPLVQDLLGSIYSLMGDYGVARQCFETANRLQPDHPPYLLNYANNLVYSGELDAANAVFNKIVSLSPDSPQAHWHMASASKATDERHIQQMEDLAARNRSPRVRAFYYYAIGKECEDLGQWDRAFDAFSRGAAARRETVEYDEAAEIEMFDFLEQHCTRDWFDALPEGDPDPAPIFVLGQPRTGTTLIERIITSHSQAHSAGELQQFGLAIRRLTNHQNPKRFSADLFRQAADVDMAKLGSLYLKTCARMRGDKPRFVDKLPQNYLLIPLILKALPNAKIVHLTREPMDACFASFKQLFADAYLHSYDQREMARHHARYRRLMDTWRERFPGRFLDISYEDAVTDLDSSAKRLLAHLELPWEDACLDFHTQKQAVSTASAAQVREPVHTRSLGRWKKYATQLAPMIEELRNQGIATDSI
ncbi:Tetratricopeptide repeat-containing protein [Microbulbifer donghaiensis]|uniref:Tetratricopeptide repeat-containing protein n=1 Tax=Microbulbifer donghaiensis TaxID=494016 RepID=A0A1M5AUR5_9GAMM|nr:tetratricopeptide repeat-containing sulfotransferase family protein [Microbulbifer donghaiensis]SHF33963.1 Tetratricopeptide repeat-containing protein [Microbulbifer donghaiensis]